MSKWRPDGWKNPFGSLEVNSNFPQYDSDLLNKAAKAQAFEAGADAMLEALRQDPEGVRSGGSGIGKWVFIPDESLGKEVT